jgi:hypothetical protein
MLLTSCHVFPGAYRHVVNEAQGHVAPDVRHPPSNVSEQQLLDAAARIDTEMKNKGLSWSKFKETIHAPQRRNAKKPTREEH